MKHNNSKPSMPSSHHLAYARLVDTRPGLVYAAASVLGPYLLATILLLVGAA